MKSHVLKSAIGRFESELAPLRSAPSAESLDRLAERADPELVDPAHELEWGTDPGLAQLRDDAARFFQKLAHANFAMEKREAQGEAALRRARAVAATEPLRREIDRDYDRLVSDVDYSHILQIAREGHPEKARRYLADARRQTSNPKRKKRIDEILSEPRNFISPLKSAPSMVTFNGFGTALYGRRSAAPDGTHIATLYLVALFIPLFPIASYLVVPNGNGWTFFGKVPLGGLARWYRRSLLIAASLLISWNALSDTYLNSDAVRHARMLAQAEEALRGSQHARVLGELIPMKEESDPERRARMISLAHSALLGDLASVKDRASAGRFVGGLGTRIRQIPAALEGSDGLFTSIEERILKLEAAAARAILLWAADLFPQPSSRWRALSLRREEAPILAAAARLHGSSGESFPAAAAGRLEQALLKTRHETWDEDCLFFLRAVTPESRTRVLLARAERAWKGAQDGRDLIPFLDGEIWRPLRSLLEIDGTREVEKKVSELEALPAPAALAEPQLAWHKLGVARRLAALLKTLHDQDPLRTPASRARSWAVEASRLDPQDLTLRVDAVMYLVQEGEFAAAVELGRDRAAEPRIQTWLGIACARLGRTAEAESALRARVASDLALYVKHHATWAKLREELAGALMNSLRQGTADRHFIARLNSLPDEQANREVLEWINARLGQDRSIRAAEEEWRSRADVHAAAHELSMLRLEAGRARPAGPERESAFKEAEHLLVQLGQVSSDDPHQELRLGQVYFWMGRNDQGREIFDRLEKAGDGHLLREMGSVFRELGRSDQARRLLEKAYAALPDPHRKKAASLRALTSTSLEDREEWLAKSDGTDPFIRACLDDVRARRLMREGRYAEAVAPLRAQADYYAAHSGESASLNNASLVQAQLAEATGNFDHLSEALRLIRGAAEREGADGLVMSNYCGTLEQVGLAAILKDVLRADLLHDLPAWSWSGFRVPPWTPEEWAARVKSQPELRQGCETAARTSLLSPENRELYEIQFRFLQAARDTASIRALRERVEANPPRDETGIQASIRFQRRELLPSDREPILKSLARARSSADALRKAGHGPSLSYGLSLLARSAISAERWGLGDATPDEAVRAAEESARALDVPACWWCVVDALAARGARELAARDPLFKEWFDATPDIEPLDLIALYLEKHPDRAGAVRAQPSIRSIDPWLKKIISSPARETSLSLWIAAAATGHPDVGAVEEQLRRDPIPLERARLSLLLYPQSSETIGKAWLAARLYRQEEWSRRVAEQAASRGVLKLFFK